MKNFSKFTKKEQEEPCIVLLTSQRKYQNFALGKTVRDNRKKAFKTILTKKDESEPPMTSSEQNAEVPRSPSSGYIGINSEI